MSNAFLNVFVCLTVHVSCRLEKGNCFCDNGSSLCNSVCQSKTKNDISFKDLKLCRTRLMKFARPSILVFVSTKMKSNHGTFDDLRAPAHDAVFELHIR